MADRRLVFASRSLMVGLRAPDDPAGLPFGDWILAEKYEPNAHVDVRPGLGRYHLEVSRPVHSLDEFWRLKQEGIDLLEDLQLVWAYAWGTPMQSSGFGVFLRFVEVPNGWSSNADEVRADLARDGGGPFLSGTGTVTSRHWRFVPYFPLRRALQALLTYRAYDEDDVVRELIHLHYRAHITNDPDGPALLLSKALEVVRRLLPGRTDDEKQAGLTPGVENLLSHSLHALCEMANNRRETRHAVVRGDAVLHPPLADTESLDFLKSADLVINAVVAERLGLKPLLPEPEKR